jgi:hypothetical protein
MLYRGVLAVGPRHIVGVTAIDADDAGEVWAVTIGGVLAKMRAPLCADVPAPTFPPAEMTMSASRAGG